MTIKRRNLEWAWDTKGGFHFVREVLDRIKLDCTHDDKDIYFEDADQCMNRTEKVREHLQPLLKQVMLKQYHIAKDFVIRTRNTEEWYGYDFICLWHLGFPDEELNWAALAWGFARAFDASADKAALEEALITDMAAVFRTPLIPNVRALKRFINDSLFDEDPDWYRPMYCSNDSEVFRNDFSDEAVAATYAMYAMTGLKDVRHDLTLGSLLIQDYELAVAPLENSSHLYDQEATMFMQNLLDLILRLEGNVTGVASGYLNMDVYANVILDTYVNNSTTEYETDCSGPSELSCLEDLIGEMNELRSLMLTIMKYWLHPASRLIYEKQELMELDSMSKTFGFSVKDKSVPTINKHPVIYSCKYGYEAMSHKCDLFSRLYTMGGIGYTFNNDKFWNIYRETEMNSKFYHEMYEKEESQEDILPRNTIDNGQPFSLTMYVDPSSVPHLTVHAPTAVPDTRHEVIELEVGKTYTISVTPTETFSDQSVLDFPFEKRNCLSGEENENLRIFNRYTQSACIFECRLRHASEVCQCTPWDYPAYDESLPLCSNKDLPEDLSIFSDVQFDKCFEEALDANKTVAGCDCPQECDELQYTYTTMIRDTLVYKNCMVSRFKDPTLSSDPFGDR